MGKWPVCETFVVETKVVIGFDTDQNNLEARFVGCKLTVDGYIVDCRNFVKVLQPLQMCDESFGRQGRAAGGPTQDLVDDVVLLADNGKRLFQSPYLGQTMKDFLAFRNLCVGIEPITNPKYGGHRDS